MEDIYKDVIDSWKRFSDQAEGALGIPVKKDGIIIKGHFDSPTCSIQLTGKDLWANSIHNETFHLAGVSPKAIRLTECRITMDRALGFTLLLYPASFLERLKGRFFGGRDFLNSDKGTVYLLKVKGRQDIFDEVKDLCRELIGSGSINIVTDSKTISVKAFHFIDSTDELFQFYNVCRKLSDLLRKVE